MITHTTLLAILALFVLCVCCEDFQYEGCGLDCLESKVQFGISQLESYFSKYLEDITIASGNLEVLDKNGVFNSKYRLDLNVTVTDADGYAYWADRSPNRITELFVTNYSVSKICDDSRFFTIGASVDPAIALQDAPRNISQFCSKFHNNTYQPYYCRNPSAFNNDMVRTSIQYFVEIEYLLIAMKLHRPEVLSYYSTDVFGTALYYPPISGIPDLGYSVGAGFVWPAFFYVSPSHNPKRKAIFSPPYADQAGNGFIVTALSPVYFGDFWWGSVNVDISMSLGQKQVDSLKPTSNSLTILSDNTGLVILASDLAYYKLFNLTPSTNVEDQKKTVFVYDSYIKNFISTWKYLANNTNSSGHLNVTLQNGTKSTRYILQYSRLTILENWVFMVFAPEEELFPKIEHVELSLESALILLIISCCSLVIPLLYSILIISRWDSPIVSSISPPFTLASVFGSILLDISPIFLTTYIQNCMAWLWFLTIGFVLFFGGFLVKTYRIERIFTLGVKKFKKAKGLKNKHLFPSLLCLVGIQIVLLIIWTVVAPLEIKDFPDDTYTNLVIKTCGSTDPGAFWGFFGSQFIYVGLIMVVACYYSFKTKNIHLKEFREAKQILFAVYNFSFVVVIIAVVASVIHTNPNASFMVIGVGTVFATTLSLLVWLGPRMLRVLRNQTSDSSSGNSQETSSQQNEKKGSSKNVSEHSNNSNNSQQSAVE
eukprot:TRINITY_DN11309_c0_g1_i1.p1 TRINITY_DN11309_c0_g1~~TRINITY_DN11309_c0_g1_i1.p1  ORF type:complete len:711 (-),score=67.76 TRINITY_DN11309_c0_g1_i1:39-2171(-)